MGNCYIAIRTALLLGDAMGRCLLMTITAISIFCCLQVSANAETKNDTTSTKEVKVQSIPQRIVSYENDGGFDCAHFAVKFIGYKSVQDMISSKTRIAEQEPFVTTAEGAALVADALFAAMYGMDTAVEGTGEYIPLKIWQDKTNKVWVISRQHPSVSSDGSALPDGSDHLVIRPDGQVVAIWTKGAKLMEQPPSPPLEPTQKSTKPKINTVPTNRVIYTFCGSVNYKTYMNKYGKGIAKAMTKSAIEQNIIRTVDDATRVMDALLTAQVGSGYNVYDGFIVDPIPSYLMSEDTEYNMWNLVSQLPPDQPDGRALVGGYDDMIMQKSDGRVVYLLIMK